MKFLNKPPGVLLGDYTKCLEDVFFNGSFGGGYGGKSWGVVARVLREYVYGDISGEIFLDTAFTLCHNNGPIFNKGLFYKQHEKKDIMQILDVQASGQIPEYVYADGLTIEEGHKDIVYNAKDLFHWKDEHLVVNWKKVTGVSQENSVLKGIVTLPKYQVDTFTSVSMYKP